MYFERMYAVVADHKTVTKILGMLLGFIALCLTTGTGNYFLTPKLPNVLNGLLPGTLNHNIFVTISPFYTRFNN